jgi:uncharacterized damage-inducible protein DinB
MAIKDAFLPEFDQEMATTRRVLARIPEDKADWKPHEKSFSLGKLSSHLAFLPYWGVVTLKRTELDFGAAPDKDTRPDDFTTTEALLASFDEKVRQARAAIESTSDEDFMVKWTLRNGEHVAFSLPRVAVLRAFVLSHLIHHRGQMSVYLRLLDVPVPSIYGPTADEPM